MILSRDGQIILVGTPKGANDIFARIEQRIKEEPLSIWRFYKFPAILDYDTKELQCADRFTWKQIMDKRLTMGALKFSREYQLEFFSREQSLFPEIIREPALHKGKDMKLLTKFDTRGSEWTYVMGVDVARSGSASADFTVAIVLAYNAITQVKQIVHFWRAKGYKISNQASEIARIARNFDNCQVLVEQNNVGQDMIDDLADDWNVGVETFITGGRGQKKEELIRFLITAFEREQLIIPQGDDLSKSHMNILIDELSKFCVLSTPAGNEQFKGLGAHDDCLRKGVLIKTIRGLKKIEDIKIGDYVLTHKGRFRKVYKTIKKPFKGKAYEIKPFCSNIITLTYNHPLLVSTRNGHTKKMNKEKWVLPTDIKKHRTMYKVNKEVSNKEMIIDMLKYMPNKNAKCNHSKVWIFSNNKINRRIEIDKDFLRFIGLYLAEGCFNNKNNTISFGLNTNETNIREFVVNFISKNIHANAIERINGNSCSISFSNVFWYNFFKKFGKKENKRLPFELGFEYLKPKLQLYLLNGWMEGDGYTDSRNLHVGATISPHIANLMFDILLRNNINPNIRTVKRHRYEVKCKDQYWIEFKEKFGNNRKTKLENSYRYSAIQYVKEIELDEEVYNLEVEEDESFVVEQTIVHNCVMALALANKATQVLGTPFAVTNFGTRGSGTSRDTNPMGAYLSEDSGETDLVKMIRMGIIK